MNGVAAPAGTDWLDVVSKIADSLGGLATAVALVLAL